MVSALFGLEVAGIRAGRLELSLLIFAVVAFVFSAVYLVRHRFRFSLRTLLVFNVVCGLGLGVLAPRVFALRGQRSAIVALRSAKAKLNFETSVPEWLLEVFGADITDGDVVGVVVGSKGGPHLATDSSLSHVRRLMKLRSVEVYGPTVTEEGLSALADLDELEVIQLGAVPVRDRGLEFIKNKSKLRVLWLDSTLITDAGLENLANATRLEELVLDGSGVTDRCVEALGRLKHLRLVSLNDTLVTDEAVAKLREMLPEAAITNRKMISRDKRRAVEQVLHFGGFVDYDQSTMTVKTVDLANCGVNDEDLVCLRSLKNLETLELGSNIRITDAGLANLSNMLTLKHLLLYKTGVTGSGLVHVASLPKLHSVLLQNTLVSDAGVLVFQDSPTLKSLMLGGTLVSEEAFLALKKSLPQCEVTDP
jgi:hypothetical protein